MKALITFLVLLSYLAIAQIENPVAKATIYFLRTKASGPTAMFARIDGKPVVKIGSANYSIHSVEPGNHYVTVTYKDYKKEGERLLTVNMESGKTYYFELVISGGLHCAEIKEEEAKQLMRKMIEEDRYLK